MLQRILQSRATTVILVVLCVVFAVHIFQRQAEGVRVDLTEDDLYSLTPGSEGLLAKMRQEGKKPVDITLYFSETTGKTLPRFIKNFLTYERYVRSLLREYERASEGRLRVEFVDPLPDSDEEQDALEAGLDGKVINQEGDRFFFGLLFETQTGSREVVEFLWPDQQENLEYEISKTLYRLQWPVGGRIGVISSLEVLGSGADNPYMQQMLAAQGRQPQQPWVVLDLLRELYQVESLGTDVDEISRDVYDLLLVIHPKSLPVKTQWAIDQWVTTGGNALIFLDPYAIDDQPAFLQSPQQQLEAMQYQPASNLEPLLAAWGLQRPENQFAVDLDLAVQRPTRTGGTELFLIDLLLDGSMLEQTLAPDHPVFQGLTDLRLVLAGALERVDGVDNDTAGVEYTPLITTTVAGTTLEIQPGFGAEGLHYMDLGDPAKLRDRYSPGTEKVVLAYQLSGRLPSAFPQGVEFPAETPAPPPGLPPGIELPPPADAEMVRREPVAEEQRDDATVLVFADVDLLSDQIAFASNVFNLLQAANDNHKVLLNAVDYLLGSEELMQVRAKHSIDRPFLRFDEIEASAAAETLERERQLREDIQRFQEELSQKQSEMTQRNAALMEKQLRDEVERVNTTLTERERELREIRKERRQALEREEASVRFSVLVWMPLLVLLAGIGVAWRRRAMLSEALARRAGTPAAGTPAAGAPAAGNEVEVAKEKSDDA